MVAIHPNVLKKKKRFVYWAKGMDKGNSEWLIDLKLQL